MAQQLRGVRLHQVNSTDESDGEPDVDIIAIHGLDTKSPDTWTWRSKDGDKPDVNWLSDPDMLPARLKRVRIFTCDWPADLIQDSSSVPWTVGEFARRLLAGILDMRLASAADAKSRGRPIIFIASCLGGIILVKALVMADRPESDYHAIRKATRGVVFLATPFRGTSFQDIAVWVEPMLKTWASLRNRSVAQLLDSVKGSTYDLEQLVRTFTRVCQNVDYPFKIQTFYETRETILQSKVLPVVLLPWLGQSKLLVDRSSATLDIDSDPLPLERRHVMMNKFCGPQDADYKVVAGRLDALLQMARNGPLQQADVWIREKHYTADRLQIQRLSGQRLPMDQCYINLVIVERSGGLPGNSTSAQSSPFSVFARQKVEPPNLESQIELPTLFSERSRRDGGLMYPRRIFIQGRAGVGKTTLCKKIVHEFQRGTWTKWNKLFDRILWVPLRNLKLEERKRPGYNYECLFGDEYFSLPESRPKLAREMAKALATGNSKTLFLLDGLDEVSQFLVGEGSMACFLQDLLKQPNVIITSRPSAKSPPRMDLELETIGFYDEQVEAYLNADPGIEPKVNEVKSFLQRHWLLEGLVRIPVQLDALCYTWDDCDTRTSPETMTAIYQSIEQKLWRKDGVNLGRMNQDEAESAHCTEIEDKVEPEVKLLEYLAFSGMYSDVLDFTLAHREKVAKAWRSSNKAHALVLPLDDTLGRLSFLRSSDSSTRLKDRSYHFIHLTFQEYFAARYFVRYWSSQQSSYVLELGTQQDATMAKAFDPDSFLQSEKYNARYDVFWRFVTGLLHAQLGGNDLCRLFHMIEDQPRDLLGPVHQRLIMHCLSEVPSSDDSKSFAFLRETMEHQLSRWLEFACTCKTTGQELLVRDSVAARFVGEVEFPERSLNNVLQRASEDVRKRVVRVLRDCTWVERSRLPRGTIELVSPWIVCEGIDPDLKYDVLWILHRQKELPVETLSALVSCIDDYDDRIRSFAISILGAQQTLPEEIRHTLATRVEKRDLHLHRGALIALAGLPLEYAIDTTVAELHDPDDEIRRCALLPLGDDLKTDPYVIKAVATCLQDDDPGIRFRALIVLDSQRDKLPDDVVRAVAARLGNEHDNPCRELTVLILACPEIQSEDVLKCITAHLQAYDEDTQLLALSVLDATSAVSMDVAETIAASVAALVAARTDILQSVLWYSEVLQSSSSLQEPMLHIAVHWLTDSKSHNQSVGFRLLNASPTLPGDIIVAMAKILQTPGEATKLKILHVFARQSALPADVLRMVSAQLRHQSKRVIKGALKVLTFAWHGTTQDLPLDLLQAVVAHLTDEDNGIQCKVLEALSGPSKLPDDILSAIASRFKDPDQHTDTRCAALSALRNQPQLPTDIVIGIEEQLQDRNEAVRKQAILTLGHQAIVSQSSLKILAAHLSDRDEGVRDAAARALRNRSLSADILGALAARLADPSCLVRSAALEALQDKRDLPKWIVDAVTRRLSSQSLTMIALRVLHTQSPPMPKAALRVIESRLRSCPESEKLELLGYLQSHPSLPDDILHVVTAQLLACDANASKNIVPAAVKVLGCQVVLPASILNTENVYEKWLLRSFEEPVSCYVMEGVIYLDMPDGLGKVALRGDPDEFLQAMLERQKELGVPCQTDHVRS
ncbi:armadillo-type protein [Trichoderma aethiopicum]